MKATLLCAVFLSLPCLIEAWILTLAPPTTRSTGTPGIESSLRMASTALAADEDNDGEYEYVEYDNLSEADFVGSEWLVGTNFNRRPKEIKETWVRLIRDDKGKNKCVWGDMSEGVWSVDAASQYVSMSKNYLWGKSIWAGVAEDYYYLQGTVRSWSYVSAAEVDGQWQARRLGVDPEEAGVAPWFEEAEKMEAASDLEKTEVVTSEQA